MIEALYVHKNQISLFVICNSLSFFVILYVNGHFFAHFYFILFSAFFGRGARPFIAPAWHFLASVQKAPSPLNLSLPPRNGLLY